MVAAQATLPPARDRILEAAERVVTDVGPAHLTLELVAQAAGMSKGGLLYHFPSKESLLVALAKRYVDGIERSIETAKAALPGDMGAARDLKACVLGVLGTDASSKAMGAVLLAAAANDLVLLEIVRERIALHTRELASGEVNFARAAVVTLAIDGLKTRESLRISPFTEEQRAQVVHELLAIADESGRRSSIENS
jgi:AcrR family transcriptional regulator